MRLNCLLCRPVLGCAVVAILCGAGCDRWASDAVTAARHQPRQIYALGQLEPAGGIISISAIPGERLLELDPDVVENQREPANGILGVLASYNLGQAQLGALLQKKDAVSAAHTHQLAMAKAQKKQAEASLAQAHAKLKELELQTIKLSALEVASQLAAEDFAQLEALHAQDPELATEHQLRKRANEMEMAQADFRIAKESYGSAKEAADKAVAAAEASARAAEISLEQLSQRLEEQGVAQEIEIAQETLKRSVLLSPSVSPATLENVFTIETVADHPPGSTDDRGPLTVLKIFLRPGEFVSQMPIMQLGDLSRMVCVAEVYEADVKDLHVGQAAVIRSPAFAGKFADGVDPQTRSRTGGMAGTIERIGNVIGSPGLANRNPLAPADRSVVEVRVTIDDPEAIAEAAQRVGLQVTVEFVRTETSTGAEADAKQ